MLTCWDSGEQLLPSQTLIWFYLIVLNKRWHTHILSRHFNLFFCHLHEQAYIIDGINWNNE